MFAVAFAQTAVETLRLAHAGHVLYAARVGAVKLHAVGPCVAGALTAHHGHLGRCGRSLQTEYGGHLFHHFLSAGRAVEVAQRTALTGLHAGGGETRTAGVAASAAVGLRQDFSHLPDARVLVHGELLRSHKQHHGADEAHEAEHDDSN